MELIRTGGPLSRMLLEKSCVYIAPRTPAPEHSLTRGSRRAFNPDLGHLDLSQPGARDDQGHRQEFLSRYGSTYRTGSTLTTWPELLVAFASAHEVVP